MTLPRGLTCTVGDDSLGIGCIRSERCNVGHFIFDGRFADEQTMILAQLAWVSVYTFR